MKTAVQTIGAWGALALCISLTGCDHPTRPSRQTDTFGFTLPSGSSGSVVVGPVRVGNGPLDVTINFAGNYVILACVGTVSSCIPMGGRPSTGSFNIPADFEAGPVQARVYFNFNYAQPAGDANGTVSFTYNPL